MLSTLRTERLLLNGRSSLWHFRHRIFCMGQGCFFLPACLAPLSSSLSLLSFLLNILSLFQLFSFPLVFYGPVDNRHYSCIIFTNGEREKANLRVCVLRERERGLIVWDSRRDTRKNVLCFPSLSLSLPRNISRITKEGPTLDGPKERKKKNEGTGDPRKSTTNF